MDVSTGHRFRAMQPCRQVAQDCYGISVGRNVQRPAQHVYAPACARGRVARVAPELRGTEIGGAPPPVRERPVTARRVEGPYVEVFDAGSAVQVVQGGILAWRPADEPAGVASRTARAAREQAGSGRSGEIGQTEQVNRVD